MRSHFAALVALTCGCQPAIDTARTPEPYDSFGGAIYREGCQRLAFTGQLALHEAGLLERIDVSGGLGRSVCIDGQAAPAGAPPKLVAMLGERSAVIGMVDAALPQPFLATLQTFLERIGPLYDDGTMEQGIVKIADALETLKSDPAVTNALARLGHRHGYRPADLAPGLMHALVEYPDLDTFIGSVLGLIAPGGAAEAEWHALLAASAVTMSTATPEVDPASRERTLRLALDLMLAKHDDIPRGKVYPAIERDARGMPRLEAGITAPFVDLDGDQLPDIDDAQGRFVDASGAPLAIATPFPEPGETDNTPRDSAGRALTSAGESSTLYHYLDLDGTVLAGVLREAPALLDPSKDSALGLVWSAQPLLGPRVMASRTYTRADGTSTSVAYQGFDTTRAPALDLLHAFIQLLGAPAADSVLGSAATLLDRYESPASRTVAAILDTSDRGKRHPEAQIVPTSTLFDDLTPLVVRVLRVPGLAQDLLLALQDPHVKGLAPMVARLMTVANQVDFNRTKAAIGAARGAPNFDIVSNLDTIVPVDRSRPDSDQDDSYNRSLMQRIAHLVHDANGQPFCNKDNAKVTLLNRTIPLACHLFEIDDLGLFFALNLASDSIRMDKTRFETTYSKASFREQITDDVVKGSVADNIFGDTSLQNLVGITGFKRFPTPKALGRALLLHPDDPGIPQFLLDTIDPLPCKDKDLFIKVHDKSVFAWELTLPDNPSGFPSDTFFDAVRPIVDAFAKHDECASYDANQQCVLDAQSHNAVKIFVDFFAMLHEHWASPHSTYFGLSYQSADRNQGRFAFTDNVVSFEPLIAEVLNGDLVPSLIELAPVLSSFTIDGTTATQPALPVLLEAMRYVFDPAATPAGLTYRSGATSTVEGDGRTPVPRATPFHLLADAFLAKRGTLAALSATPDGAMQADKWKAATSLLVDELLTVDRVDDSSRFRNRLLHGIAQRLIRFVRDRLAAHTAAGDLDAWIHHDLTADVTDKLTGPVAAALGDLAARLEHDDAARAQFYGLLNYLLDERGHAQVFQTVLTTLADQAQQFLDDRNLVPIAHALGAISDPAKGIVDAEIALVKRSHDRDADRALLTVLRNLYRPGTNGVHPASELADIVSELNRIAPGHGGDLDARDEQSWLGEVRDFLSDNQRGFMRFVKIVQNRSVK